MNKPCGCCNNADKDLSLKSVMSSYLKSMARWAEQGFPVVDNVTHQNRIAICNECIYKRKFRCSQCNCLIYVKTKLASEACPLETPKWNSI